MGVVLESLAVRNPNEAAKLLSSTLLGARVLCIFDGVFCMMVSLRFKKKTEFLDKSSNIIFSWNRSEALVIVMREMGEETI